MHTFRRCKFIILFAKFKFFFGYDITKNGTTHFSGCWFYIFLIVIQQKHDIEHFVCMQELHFLHDQNVFLYHTTFW